MNTHVKPIPDGMHALTPHLVCRNAADAIDFYVRAFGAVMTERLQRATNAGDVAVVVGAPDVDDLVEAALQLVEVVGNVGCEIGVLTVVALDDAILLIAESGRAEPAGAGLAE